MHREYSRSDRLAQLLQRELAELVRLELKDPRIGRITILEVEVSRDLATADVYFSMLEASEHSELEQALNRAAGFLRRSLGRRVALRNVPRLRFHYDETEERAMALTRLIDAAVERDRETHED